ncbi:MAG: hypothetical protein KF791_13325 [Verrucomicrobiae bacterium]|nr:hypothetical protein [Verrucomicrobiae bacterium]
MKKSPILPAALLGILLFAIAPAHAVAVYGELHARWAVADNPEPPPAEFGDPFFSWSLEGSFLLPDGASATASTPPGTFVYAVTDVTGRLYTDQFPLNETNPQLAIQQGSVVAIAEGGGSDRLIVEFDVDPAQIDLSSVGAQEFLKDAAAPIELAELERFSVRKVWVGPFFDDPADAGNRDKVAALLVLVSSPEYILSHPGTRIELWFGAGSQAVETEMDGGGSLLTRADARLDPSFGIAGVAAGTSDLGGHRIGYSSAAVQADHKVLWVGAVGGLERRNPDGTVDAEFTRPSGIPAFRSIGGSHMALLPDGKSLVSAEVVRSDAPSFSKVAFEGLARLHPDGTLDTEFDLELGNYQTIRSLGLTAIAVQTDGKILIAGNFDHVSHTPRNGVARIHPDGSLDHSFNAGFGPVLSYGIEDKATIHRLLVQEDGRILVGGYFDNFNGAPRSGIARLNADGSLDTGFDPQTAGIADKVSSMLVQADGRILVCGRRWIYDHQDPKPPGGAAEFTLIRLLPNGHPDLEFTSSVRDQEGFEQYSSVVAAQADGNLLVSAVFQVRGRRVNRILRLFPDGTVDPSFDSGTGSHTNPILQADGRIIASSAFPSGPYNWLTGGAARLLNDPATQNLVIPNTTRVDWLRGGTAPETTQVWFELSTDSGSNWTHLGPGIRCPGGWALEEATLPTSGTLRARARIGSSDWGLVEQTLDFSLPVVPSDFNVAVASGIILVTDNTGSGGSLTVREPAPGHIEFTAPGRMFHTASVDPVLGSSGSFPLAGISQIIIRCGPGEDTIAVEAFAAILPDLVIQSGTGADTLTLRAGSTVTLVDPDGFTLHEALISGGLTIETQGPVIQAGPLAGGMYLRKLGIGALTLSEANTHQGETSVSGGVLALVHPSHNPLQASARLTIQHGAVLDVTGLSDGRLVLSPGQELQGHGMVAGALEVPAGSKLSAGAVPGTLDLGDLALQEGAVLAIQLQPHGGGTDHDQLRVSGTVSLGGATLALSTPWFQDLERTFVIIRNDGDGDVLGSFDGLPEGSRLKAPGTESEHLTISYRGGDGNDVTLTSTVQAGDVNTGFRTGDLLSSGMAEVYSAIGLGDGSVLIGGLVVLQWYDVDGDYNTYDYYLDTITLDSSGQRFDFHGTGGVGGRILAFEADGGLISAFGGGWGFQPPDPNSFVDSGIIRLVRHPLGFWTEDANFVTSTAIHGVAAPILGMVLQRDGRILVAGDGAETPNGRTAGIARLKADGSLDATFLPGTGANGTIFCMGLQDDGKIIIGGLFDSFDGIPRNQIARLHPDGTLDAAFVPAPGLDGGIHALAIQADGKIVAAGSTTEEGGTRYRLVRFHADGSLDAGFAPGLGSDVMTSSLVLQVDGGILATTIRKDADGTSRGSTVLRLLPDGAMDSTFAPATSPGDVRNAVLEVSGQIIITGDFEQVNGVSQYRISRLINDPGTHSMAIPSATRVEWHRQGTRPEAAYAWFEHSADEGTTWTLLGPGHRIPGGWALTGVTLPATGSIRARARVLTTGLNATTSVLDEAVVAIPQLPPTAARLAHFRSAATASGEVQLTWETLVEVDTLGFHVERGTPSGAWERLTSQLIPALGSSERSQVYGFTDKAPGTGAGTRYRLVEVERKGDEIELAVTHVPAVATALLPPGESRLSIVLRGARHGDALVESAPSIEGPWTPTGSVTLDELGAAVLAVELPTSESVRFYRLVTE